LVAILEMHVNEVMVIGHTDCGVQDLDADHMIEELKNRNIRIEQIVMLKYMGIDFNSWLCGFGTVEESVKNTVVLLQKHPLIPKDVVIVGFVMDSLTGELHSV